MFQMERVQRGTEQGRPFNEAREDAREYVDPDEGTMISVYRDS